MMLLREEFQWEWGLWDNWGILDAPFYIPTGHILKDKFTNATATKFLARDRSHYLWETL